MCVTMLGKRYIDCIPDIEEKKIFERLWMQSYRKDASRIYVKLSKDCICILYRDFTKFKYEHIDKYRGHSGKRAIQTCANAGRLYTHIGNFSKCILKYNLCTNKTLVIDTRYRNNLCSYDNYSEAIWRVSKAASKLDKFNVDKSTKYLVWEILLNIVQHNFTEGITLEYYNLCKRK